MNLRVPTLLALLLAGSLVAGLSAGAMGAAVKEGYTLRPGDTIDIVVVGDQDLSRAVTIKPEGTIDLPLVGEVTAAGKTTSQLAADLTKRYSRYLVAPSITVAVREFRVDRIYVLGQVNRPGEFQIRPGVGANPSPGSSAFRRASIAWPRGGGGSPSRRPPAAMWS